MPGIEPPNETPVAAPPDPNSIREKAIRLFRYLTALAELRAKNVRDVSSYESVFWFAELPHEKECYTAAWDGATAADEETWLRIERPERPVLTQPPAECKDWFDAATLEAVSPEPRLLEEIIDPQWVPATVDDGGELDSVARPRLLLRDHPRVASAWEAYLKTTWRPWSVRYLRWERVQRAYRKLFAIYQEQQRRGEQYELVLGVGVLLWTTPNEHKVRRPIVTAQATIELENESGRITIAPAVDGANFALEQDMMEVNERPPIHDQRQVEGKVSSVESPWDREVITPILKCWLHSLPSAADAIYHDSLECPDRSTRVPQMAFSPILILRKRGAHSTREALKKIVKGLSDGKPIPRGVRLLCGAVDEPDLRHELKTESASPADDILFPLPTNDEQLAIIRRLHGHSGVLVQGPPGTGKSHTIVNLVCHLLAQGRRVLVTSQTPRALKVLREKIPEAILPLVVSLLGEDSESRQNLEYSVQGILRHVNAADPVDPRQLISEKTRERASLRSRLAALRCRLREVREAETTVYCIPGTPYQGTAQTIAQTLSHDHASLSWLADQISADAEPPLTDGGLKELHAFWEQYSERSITYALPAPDSLPTADQLEAAKNLCSRTGDALRQSVISSDLELARRLCELGRVRLEELRKIAEDAVQSSEWLAKRAEPWIAGVRQEVLAGRVQPWSSLEKATSKVLEALAGKSAEPDIKAPAGVTRPQLLADAADLLAHLKRGGLLGFWVFRPEVVRRCLYILHETRFAGRPCNSPAVIKSLLTHLQEQEALDRAWLEWSAIVEPPQGTTRHRLACLEQHHEVLKSILRLGSLVSNAGIAVGERRPNGTPGGSCWLRELLHNIQTAIALSDDRDSQAALSVLIDKTAKCRILVNPHPILDDLIVAAENCDVPEYRMQLAKLVDLHHERSQAERCLSLDRRLREVAPALADALKSPEARPTLAAQLDSFRNAWAWKRATAWLERFSAQQSADVAPELDEAERRLQEATATLVALKAWKSCSDKLASDSMQQGALVAWQKMVKKIGKGTGKYAETYRRDARKYLQQCRNAIPAWIMPLYRVAEQVEIEPGIFDVVIVDESSQTGPEGLILQYLAKQCVIVGDDKQISPEGGFIEGTQVRTLMEQHLDGLPFSETLGPATSLFDQAAVRYGNRITLREHFRCMPEIIRFSDELCYADTPLIPLRQYPPSRLPPLQVRFVVDGYREGTAQQAINRPEAAAVAKTLIDCLDDPRYKGKSFGVICLQGRAQAQLIENMILDKLGPHPFKDEKIRLLCGDPYSFQGDERDVVFLSMVASVEGETRTSPLTKESFRQRFNVAASRARDQAWLFHSIRESDLHPDCMRRRLLHYYYNPSGNGLNLNGKGRTISKFQREVGEALSKAGFRLISEFEVAGRFIDWVVEDRERRLAIECDGDAWHGPDRYEADMARQRMLERCGWKFIRIRGSKFYANQSRAIRELIDAIRDHGLEPCIISDSDEAPRDWVKEISGEDCTETFGTQGIAKENVFEQQELFPGESEESEMAEAAELAENNAPQTSKPANDGSNPVPSNSKASAPPMADKPPFPQRPVDGAIPARRVPSHSASERLRTNIVNAQERAAVFKALDEADRPLIMWQIARGSKISQRRVEEIIPILVHEGIVRRVESDIAVMYARA